MLKCSSSQFMAFAGGVGGREMTQFYLSGRREIRMVWGADMKD